jgi:hypothetical protein
MKCGDGIAILFKVVIQDGTKVDKFTKAAIFFELV